MEGGGVGGMRCEESRVKRSRVSILNTREGRERECFIPPHVRDVDLVTSHYTPHSIVHAQSTERDVSLYSLIIHSAVYVM